MERVFPTNLPNGGVKFAGVNVLLGRWWAYTEIVGEAADTIDIIEWAVAFRLVLLFPVDISIDPAPR